MSVDRLTDSERMARDLERVSKDTDELTHTALAILQQLTRVGDTLEQIAKIFERIEYQEANRR